jgi:hypothetical protein
MKDHILSPVIRDIFSFEDIKEQRRLFQSTGNERVRGGDNV